MIRVTGTEAPLDVIDLEGRTVIVTGAASGIGAATARLLHAAGAHPVLADRDPSGLAVLSKALGDALTVEVDVTNQDQVLALVTATVDRHGRLDGLVNNAGVSLHHRIDEVDTGEFSRVLAINVVGTLAVTQASLAVMKAAGFGRIVNVSSGTTRMVPLGAGPYAATKVAVNMLSAVARQELAGDGITVSIVLPSITATDFGGGLYTLGEESWPGLVTHSASYPARAIIRALRTGEEAIDVPHGPERDDAFAPYA